MKIGLIVAVLLFGVPLHAGPVRPVVNQTRLADLFVHALELSAKKMLPAWTAAARTQAVEDSLLKFGRCARERALSVATRADGVTFVCQINPIDSPDTMTIDAKLIAAADPYFSVVQTEIAPDIFTLWTKDGFGVSDAEVAAAVALAGGRVEARRSVERAEKQADEFAGPCP